ncbi:MULTISPECIES: hypothetical protein [Microbacterium]|uniref:Uncharacterized protein n=1 Tax=Microbacterium hominis TaxID=162426 RepID=A0A2K9DEW5_9MICO|nr:MULTISPECIES: hypothetical protein [Microbacterium]AUG29469.1 hypothetical protein CXR34_08325 [Microbacterium hominis]EPD84174.1 hypothetical protein HMPREF1529_02214 [Microbacterium sp. oral taxon 186 str. F0373]
MNAAALLATETREHEMTVLHEDGLYRHIRFGRPDTALWSFTLTTWPHHLAISGDIGDGWTFSDRDDMFEFFGSRSDAGVNLAYWWEKLPASQRTAARAFSEDRLLRLAVEDITGWGMVERDRASAVEHLRMLWADCSGDERDYRKIVNEFTWVPTITTHEVISGTPIRFRDSDDWDSEEFCHNYQIACHAIAFGARRYREARGA